MQKEFIDQLSALLSTPKKCVIFPHKNPDGDALGSSLALGHFLQQKGHDCKIISPNEYPQFLAWMPGQENILCFFMSCCLRHSCYPPTPTGLPRRVGFYGSPSPKASESPLYALDLTSSQLPRLHRDLQLSKWTLRTFFCWLTRGLLLVLFPTALHDGPVCARRRAPCPIVACHSSVAAVATAILTAAPNSSVLRRVRCVCSHLLTGEPSELKRLRTEWLYRA